MGGAGEGARRPSDWVGASFARGLVGLVGSVGVFGTLGTAGAVTRAPQVEQKTESRGNGEPQFWHSMGSLLGVSRGQANCLPHLEQNLAPGFKGAPQPLQKRA
jgi:hypothetical protein